MDKIGLFFCSETGTTRLVAKKMQKKLGDALCDKPVNVNRCRMDDLLQGFVAQHRMKLPGGTAYIPCYEIIA